MMTMYGNLDEIKVAYLEAYEEGRAPTLQEMARRYPEYRDDLVDFITTVIELDSALQHVPEPPEPSESTRRLREQVVRDTCGIGTLRDELARASVAREDAAASAGVPVSFIVRVERGRLIPDDSDLAEERFRVRLGKALRRTGDEVRDILRRTFEAPRGAHTSGHARSRGEPQVERAAGAAPQHFRDLLAGCEDLTPSQRREWLLDADDDERAGPPDQGGER